MLDYFFELKNFSPSKTITISLICSYSTQILYFRHNFYVAEKQAVYKISANSRLFTKEVLKEDQGLSTSEGKL